MERSEYPLFVKAVSKAFCLYPGAALGDATFPAWFEHLSRYDLAVVVVALDRAVASSPQFMPSAPTVREHCEAVAKTGLKPRGNLDLPALPEAMPEIAPDLRSEFEAINNSVRSGELDDRKAGAAYLRAIAERL